MRYPYRNLAPGVQHWVLWYWPGRPDRDTTAGVRAAIAADLTAELDELAGKIADVRDDSRVRYCQRRRAGIRAQLQERGHAPPPLALKS